MWRKCFCVCGCFVLDGCDMVRWVYRHSKVNTVPKHAVEMHNTFPEVTRKSVIVSQTRTSNLFREINNEEEEAAWVKEPPCMAMKT